MTDPITNKSRSASPTYHRQRVTRADGKTVQVIQKRGHLSYCLTGCCCGHTDRGFAPVPVEAYKREWLGRKLRNIVHLTKGGCLGPCALANVACLVFDGRSIWFHSIGTDWQVGLIFDYIEAMLAQDSYLEPPADLREYIFDFYDWQARKLYEKIAGYDSRESNVEQVALTAQASSYRFALLSHADTDLLTLQHSRALLEPELNEALGNIFGYNLMRLPDEAAMHSLLEQELAHAEVIVLRLHGRLEALPARDDLLEAVAARAQHLLILSGTNDLSPDFARASTVPAEVLQSATAYLAAGGSNNMLSLWRYLSDRLRLTSLGYEPAQHLPAHGYYHPQLPEQAQLADWRQHRQPQRANVAVLFYRAHLLSGNLGFVDALLEALEQHGLNAIGVYTSSLREVQEGIPAALHEVHAELDVLVSSLAFAVGKVNTGDITEAGTGVQALERLGLPIIQAISSGMVRGAWQASSRGLNALDTAMNVALPEFDGRIISVPISFKERREDGVSVYVPDSERCARLAGITARLARLRQQANHDKRIAVVLTNSGAKASNVGNAVGLDAPASLLRLLQQLRGRGYQLDRLPHDSDTLIHALLARGSYDDTYPLDEARAIRISRKAYCDWFADFPTAVKAKLVAWWGEPQTTGYTLSKRKQVKLDHEPHSDAHDYLLAGLEYGNVFIGLQPPRGYGMDPDAIYHTPDLPPTHHYSAFYRWLSRPQNEGGWGADAIIHMGKHGTLEWLPGKSLGLSSECFPDVLLEDMPLLYPFIINDPGEGSQAKRRAHAQIIDHLTPALTSAETYGDLAELAQLVNEYYLLESLDPQKLPALQQQIWQLVQATNLKTDLDLKSMLERDHGDHKHEWDDETTDEGIPVTLAEMDGSDVAHLLEDIDGYLCELGLAQIREGLHILAEVPDLPEMLRSLTRLSNAEVPALQASLARALGFDLDVLLEAPGTRLEQPQLHHNTLCHSYGDVLTLVDDLSLQLFQALDRQGYSSAAIRHILVEKELEQAPHIPDDTANDIACDISCDISCDSSLERIQHHSNAITENHLTDTIVNLPRTYDKKSGEICLESKNPLSTSHSPLPTLHSRSDSGNDIARVLHFACEHLVPKLEASHAELDNLLIALEGGYVPAGPSGAPSRGMAHILPTGRNFYAVDPRALPSSSAWQVGQALADSLLARHQQETGNYPKMIALSAWGTSAMRTHGDDVAQVLALLGVKPRWNRHSRRIEGVELIPLAELGRPRIDVTLRVSGFFRDAFPHLLSLLDEAVQLVIAQEDEALEQNYPRAHYLRDLAAESENKTDISLEEAEARASYRIFGAKPGSYGAGILGLIEQQNWQDEADFARAFLAWGGYAYGRGHNGIEVQDVFAERLKSVEVVAHNQDNREHDIFDSDDYFQFMGGMVASVRHLRGEQPKTYFGDSSRPENAKVRDLREETLRVYRSRVINPKWLTSIQQHGYKGALEMSATVDYLFGFDATAHVAPDFVYEGLAEHYALDPKSQAFLRQSNPWALRAISERLLEAAQRGMWAEPDEEVLEQLQSLLLDSESLLEGALEEEVA